MREEIEERFEELKESIWGFLEELTDPEFYSTYIPERK